MHPGGDSTANSSQHPDSIKMEFGYKLIQSWDLISMHSKTVLDREEPPEGQGRGTRTFRSSNGLQSDRIDS